MKTTFLITVLLFMMKTGTFAQWEQKISGTTNELSEVHFPSADTGYIVGCCGTILKSVNQGETWLPLNSGTLANFNAVEFLNGTVGFAGGDSGIFKTTDGGSTWNKITIPAATNADIYDIDFMDNQTGFAVGDSGVMLKTTDQGNTWQLKTCPAGTSGYLSSVHFPTSNIGYSVGGNWGGGWGGSLSFLKSTDAGETWLLTTIQPSFSIQDCESVFFTNQDTGYIGGISTFIKTTDGGNNWINIDSTATLNIHSIHFPSSDTGYAVGDGTIIKTNDNGNSWTIQNSSLPTNDSLYFVSFVNNDIGFTVGTNGIILKTGNGGETGFMNITESNLLIQIYPNPFSTQTVLRTANSFHSATLTVDNCFGQTVAEINNINGQTVTLQRNALRAGLYFVRLTENNKQIVTKKIIIID
jgi:photosystem II stability/assembly factor-like uncharacterized protein